MDRTQRITPAMLRAVTQELHRVTVLSRVDQRFEGRRMELEIERDEMVELAREQQRGERRGT